MKLNIGTAPDSWGVWFGNDPNQTPWRRYLDEVIEAGYEWTELGPYGYLPTDVALLRRELDVRRLKISGAFAMGSLEETSEWTSLQTQVIAACRAMSELNGSFLILIDGTYTDLFTGELTAPTKLDSEAWKRLIDSVHRIADIAHRDYGLHLVYHPHVETHVEYESQIERLLEDTDPGSISLCLDLGHHAYRGGDPVAFLRKHWQRVRYLHLKGVDAELQKRVERERIPFAKAVAMNLFCEPFRGVVDFAAVRAVLEEINFEGFATVEQDMYPCDFNKPLPIARRTRAYLRDIGLG